MRALRRALALTLLAASAGCTLLVDVDNLSGGLAAWDAAGGDASDAATTDALDDALADAPVDGTLDATSDAPLDGPSACAVPHTFCDDFDDGGLGARWTSQRTTNGTIALDPTMARSPSRSMLITANPIDASGTGYKVALQKTFSGSFSRIHCELDVRTSGDSPPQTASAFGLYVLASGGSDYYVLWDIHQGRLYQELDPAITTQPISLPTSGRWTRVAFELELGADAGPGKLKLWYDGAQIASVPSLGQPSTVVGVRFDLGLALGYAPLGSPWHINYDDAWCDVL